MASRMPVNRFGISITFCPMQLHTCRYYPQPHGKLTAKNKEELLTHVERLNRVRGDSSSQQGAHGAGHGWLAWVSGRSPPPVFVSAWFYCFDNESCNLSMQFVKSFIHNLPPLQKMSSPCRTWPWTRRHRCWPSAAGHQTAASAPQHPSRPANTTKQRHGHRCQKAERAIFLKTTTSGISFPFPMWEREPLVVPTNPPLSSQIGSLSACTCSCFPYHFYLQPSFSNVHNNAIVLL